MQCIQEQIHKVSALRCAIYIQIYIYMYIYIYPELISVQPPIYLCSLLENGQGTQPSFRVECSPAWDECRTLSLETNTQSR